MQAKALSKYLVQLKNQWGSLFHDQVTNVLAYGSAVIPQTANHKVIASNTLDLMIEVKDSNIFHRELLSSNRHEYAGLAWLIGSKMMEFSHSYVFPMHSNHIILGDKKVKYSIIGQKQLRKDLREWTYLSFAGRLHKAVIPLQPTLEQLQEDIKFNRQAALAIALLLFKKKQTLTFRDILEQIVQLSYTGDIRFSAGAENPKKVHNIVTHSWNQLHFIYHPILLELSQKCSGLTYKGDNVQYQLSPPLLAELLGKLPGAVQEHLISIYGGPNLPDRLLLSGVNELNRDLTDFIRKRNSYSSTRMALQNLLTASPINNFAYLMAKFKKGRNID